MELAGGERGDTHIVGASVAFSHGHSHGIKRHSSHSGHSHGGHAHGHSHAASLPNSAMAVAWMVILGKSMSLTSSRLLCS